MIVNKAEWVEAKQVTADSAAEIAVWCGGKLVEEIHPFDGTKTPGVNVPTLRGVMRASVTDYVVQNVFDEFLVVNEATYNED